MEEIPNRKVNIGGEDFEIPAAVRIGDTIVPVAPPASVALRFEILGIASDTPLRASAAALGACWRGPKRPKASYRACKYNAHVYGAQVLDELVSRGVSIGDLTAAGSVALSHLADGLPSVEGVEETADFSAAAEAPQTS